MTNIVNLVIIFVLFLCFLDKYYSSGSTWKQNFNISYEASQEVMKSPSICYTGPVTECVFTSFLKPIYGWEFSPLSGSDHFSISNGVRKYKFGAVAYITVYSLCCCFIHGTNHKSKSSFLAPRCPTSRWWSEAVVYQFLVCLVSCFCSSDVVNPPILISGWLSESMTCIEKNSTS